MLETNPQAKVSQQTGCAVVIGLDAVVPSDGWWEGGGRGGGSRRGSGSSVCDRSCSGSTGGMSGGGNTGCG